MWASLIVTLAAANPALAQTPPPALSLADALAKASQADPGADAWRHRERAAQANIQQAGVKPNPALGLEVENFGGSGRYSVISRNETTFSYQQTIERGGKREARVAAARASAEVLRRQREIRRLDFLRDVQVAYAEALAAEADLLIAEARFIAAYSAQEDVDRRVRAARDPLFAGSRAEATTAQAAIERDQARVAARNARSVLARLLGGSSDFSLSVESFFNVQAPNAAGAVAAADLALIEAERDVALANVGVERSRAIADPTLRAGVRYFGESDEVALVVGASIPLRLHDTNKAGIERSIAERNAAEADIAAERLIREREIARLADRLKSAAVESERLRAEVIPNAIRAVEQVREGFRRGGFQYMNVADAERALADARTRRVTILRQFHLDQAAFDRLTGRHAALASSNLNAERR